MDCSWHLLIGLSLRHGGVYETRGDSFDINVAGENDYVRIAWCGLEPSEPEVQI